MPCSDILYETSDAKIIINSLHRIKWWKYINMRNKAEHSWDRRLNLNINILITREYIQEAALYSHIVWSMYERRWIPFVKVRLQQNGFSALLRVRVALVRLRLVLRVVPTEKKNCENSCQSTLWSRGRSAIYLAVITAVSRLYLNCTE